MEPKATFCFEVSWEVCNKVGGIYTVVKSKAGQMMEYYGSNYFVIGPYFVKKAYGEFEEATPPEPFKSIFADLSQQGIDCHYGNWAVAGGPGCILIDFSRFASQKDAIKGTLWDKYRVDSLGTQYYDYDETVVWSTAAAKLIEALAKKQDKPVVAQFHEWLAGAGLLYCRMNNAPVATVFTTHATVLGRSMASGGHDIYGNPPTDPDKEAYARGCQSKHLTERRAAENAHVFTTVSEITSIEAGKMLQKPADIVLPNGLLNKNFPVMEEALLQHNRYKARIKEFISYYFFPYYTFDLDKTLILFLCGRYEYHDKGIDIFVNALGELNKRLKEAGSERTVVAFFWVPGNIRGIRPELLENRERYHDIAESVDDNLSSIKTRILFNLIRKHDDMHSIFPDTVSGELSHKLRTFTRKGTPPLSTHNLFNEDTDEIMQGFKAAGLNNTEQDRVKAIFYSIYLTGTDGLLQTSYYESMLGSHLGVFPSYYEPWGYTPLEAGALGVPAVTTDLAGFGQYIKHLDRHDAGKRGIFILDRLGRTEQDVTAQLTRVLHDFVNLDREGRMRHKLEAKKLAALADWKVFAEHYLEAHNKAVTRLQGGA